MWVTSPMMVRIIRPLGAGQMELSSKYPLEDKTGVQWPPFSESKRKSRLTATVSLILLLGVSACVACSNKTNPAPKNSIEEGAAPISLIAITNSNQTQTFNEVRRASLLPKAVLDQFGGLADPGQPFKLDQFLRELSHGHFGGLADPGQPFNVTDDIDPKLPTRQLVVAAVSKQYCIISYWQGGYTLTFRTDIFELSGGSARVIWVSFSQGGLNFRDLKVMVESGRMHNDLPRAHP
jgi:hypothetical protein